MKYKDLISKHEQIIATIDRLLFHLKINKYPKSKREINSLKSSLKYHVRKFEQSSKKIAEYITSITKGESDESKDEVKTKK